MLGITALVFMIMRLVPGGPMEEDMKRLMGQGEGKVLRSKEMSGISLKPEQLMKVAGQYDRDKSAFRHYLEWLGALPRDTRKSAALFENNSSSAEVTIPGTIRTVTV